MRAGVGDVGLFGIVWFEGIRIHFRDRPKSVEVEIGESDASFVVEWVRLRDVSKELSAKNRNDEIFVIRRRTSGNDEFDIVVVHLFGKGRCKSVDYFNVKTRVMK